MAVSPFVNDLMFSIRHTPPVFNTFRAGGALEKNACVHGVRYCLKQDRAFSIRLVCESDRKGGAEISPACVGRKNYASS